ncbi:MAG: hypothetical protein KAH32_02520 [Chlamydiia bacterium]|nr:hypothetical protein [Chlamydiia bacterium]
MISVYSILQSLIIVSLYFSIANIFYPLGTTNSSKIFQEPESSYLLEYNILSLRQQKTHTNIPFRNRPFLKIGMIPSKSVEIDSHKLNLLGALIRTALETNNMPSKYSSDEIAVAGLSISGYNSLSVEMLDKDLIKIWLKVIKMQIAPNYSSCINDFLDYRLDIVLGLDISLPSAIILSILGKYAGTALLESEGCSSESGGAIDIMSYYPTVRDEIMKKYGISKEIFDRYGIVLF